MKENNIWQELSLNTIYNMDCIEGMKLLADNSVDAIVTDPPYWLSFMGKKRDYDVPSQEIREEALRVLKPWWYLLAFAGTRTQHRMAVRIEDAGFEIRDMIAWVYGSGFPKSLNIGKAVDKLQGNEREVVGSQTLGYKDDNHSPLKVESGWNNNSLKNTFDLTKGTSEWEGWGTALKPALEPITVARKPLWEKNVAENVLKWGTGGINIDGCRVGTEIIKQIQATAVWSNAIGWKWTWIPQKANWIITETQWRFPANLIHDGSDEVVGLFPNTKTGNISPYISKDEGIFGTMKGKEHYNSHTGDSGSASRFFYCAKSSKSERNKGLNVVEQKNKRPQWEAFWSGNAIAEHKDRRWNHHPTVKPIALMKYLVKLVSREDAVVLDPFTWSWSTLIACKKLKRQYIWFELDEDYITIAQARIQAIKSDNSLL